MAIHGFAEIAAHILVPRNAGWARATVLVMYPPGFPVSPSPCVCPVSVGAARQGTSPVL